MKTILHVSDLVNGGLATYLESVIKHQKKSYHVKLLASREMSESRLTQDDSFINLDSYNRSALALIKAMIQTRKYYQAIKPDIIYIHSSFAGVFARLATIKLGYSPYIIYCAHGWSFLMQGSKLKRYVYKCIEKSLSHLSDSIITISQKENQGALDIGINKNKLHLIKHGISSKRDLINPNFKDAHTFDAKYIHILFLGRYDYAKGFDWLMDFIKNYQNENICWHIAGKNIVDDMVEIPTNIINHGWVEYKDISQLLLRIDTLIIPSRWEGFGLSAIEAMKYSKPVLASSNGALPELIKNDYNGKLFNLNSYQELEELVSNIDKKILEEWGKNAYNTFTQNYTQEKMLNKLDLLLKGMV
jgi:glycosyltransferase involved in cell wall biosynthesis